MALLAVLLLGLYAGMGGAIAAAVVTWPTLWPYWAALGAGIVVTVVIQTRNAERNLLDQTGARPVRRDDDPELLEITERLALLAGLPVPDVGIVDSDAPNAFALGLSPSRSVIVVTTGLRDALAAEELEAVVAHELVHIANRDAAVMTAAGVPYTTGRQLIGGDMVLISFLVWPAALPLLLLGSLLLLTLSRTREFAADRGSVLLTGSPEQLMSALQRLDGAHGAIPDGDLRRMAPVAALCVAPLRKRRLRALSAHPPLGARLAQLAEISRLAGEPGMR